jgi:sugar (pentulose or hexulose) kinase
MIAIFDIGKTNKKCFVFDEDYRIVFENSAQLPETTDEDGDPCEDLDLLTTWMLDSYREILNDPALPIRAANVSTYGASLVHLDVEDRRLTPLYNYLKPFPENLKTRFLSAYGPEEKICLETASPWLGHLNSGLQLYRLKHHRPEVFDRIEYSLHLPQYAASLLRHTGSGYAADITSIGCHTMLWDFRKNDYHSWAKAEGIAAKFPPVQPSNTRTLKHSNTPIGLHDSSAALIPYLASQQEPFALLSTGTWCITLNPFNPEPLTAAELAQDCLSYLSYDGRPVKAARYFGGKEHEDEVKKLAAEFGQPEDFYRSPALSAHPELAERYERLMRRLVERQAASTCLALGRSPVRRILVDGGFSANAIFMQLLAQAFPEMEIASFEVPQAAALGAAMAIHSTWNEKPLDTSFIKVKSMSHPR